MRHLRTLVFLMITPLTLTAGAQGIMVDPTRPPAALAATTGDAVASGGPVLQSVMLSPGRKMAMISGELVVLGGRYGSARLVKLSESEAVLKDGAETTVLKLFPLVEKRISGELRKSASRTTK